MKRVRVMFALPAIVAVLMLVLGGIAEAQKGTSRGGGGKASGGGTAVSRGSGGATKGSSGGGRTATRGGGGTVTRSGGGDKGGGRATAGSPGSTGGTTTRRGGAVTSGGAGRSGSDDPQRARPRGGDSPTQGRAVARTEPRRAPVDVRIGGWWLGGPFGIGYGRGWYDPWYGGWGRQPGRYYGRYDYGKVRLKVKPREAEVLVDGYYVGLVDHFDGLFQRLELEPGPHRLEVRAPSFRSMVFDVRVLPRRTITLEGRLQPAGP
jgi:hypothetical protein